MRYCSIPLALALVACGGDPQEATTPLTIENVTVEVTGLDQVVLKGEIVLNDAAGVGGTDGSAVFYSDDYETKIATATGVLGQGLEAEGDRESFELTTISARVEPHDDGFLRVCVDLMVANSNYETVTQAGCVDGVPDPTYTTPTTTTPPAEEPPTAEIYEPFELELYGIGETVDLDGRCTDPNQDNGSLGAVWTFQPDAGGPETIIATSLDGNGDTYGSWYSPPLGDYVIRLTCTDDNNTTDVALRNISVVDRQLTDLDGDGFTPYSGDCNDNDASRYPGAPELCDGVDQDCDLEIDNADADGDGHIDAACTSYAGVLPVDDCDDTLAGVNPLATESCDGVDQDCNGTIDDVDVDGDLHIDEACVLYDGGLPIDDCDDGNAAINPAQTEIPANLIDENCDGYDY